MPGLEDDVYRNRVAIEKLSARVSELESKFGKPAQKPVRKRVKLLYSQFNNDYAKARDHAKLAGDMEAVKLIMSDMDKIDNS